jgi:hypothetical protein
VSPSFTNDPKHRRARASEARKPADEMGGQQSKQMMLGIAKDYERLAERAEKRVAGLPPSK